MQPRGYHRWNEVRKRGSNILPILWRARIADLFSGPGRGDFPTLFVRWIFRPKEVADSGSYADAQHEPHDLFSSDGPAPPGRGTVVIFPSPRTLGVFHCGSLGLSLILGHGGVFFVWIRFCVNLRIVIELVFARLPAKDIALTAMQAGSWCLALIDLFAADYITLHCLPSFLIPNSCEWLP